jgi:dienelactone hydrolase
MPLGKLRYLALLVACMAPFRPAAAADRVIDGVPLPPDAGVASVANPQSATQRQWVGLWVGAWGGSLKHILLVESIAEDGAADVVYAIGDNPALGIPRGWTRHKAAASERSLTITGSGFSATYRVTDKGTVRATYLRGTIRSQATMAKADLREVAKPGAVVAWMRGKSELLQTDLVEDGKAIRLEAVIFKPPGAGPFPLAVFNHGSTGSGNNPALFAETWFHEGLADFLNERGWIVAFPQRRGRGRSDGLYDEGISADRAKGYTGDPERSLAGADRALRDIEAATVELRRHPDVAPSRVLVGGQSRGGALAVAYAGAHPDQVFGVINFVGGWLGESHTSAQAVNQTLFAQGARFSGRTVWLYGRPDPFYSIRHSRENFAAFEKAGGQGTFLEFDVPDGNGHYLMGYSRLWAAPVGEYLDRLAAPGTK